ncbi:alpha/beta-hydrolase [Auriculariales sp. MPI-PUGE-AT-0066]|nr:alpha/beta-hydrolase [Auriculariales sp. MPI-PUGE-AT-0066]
MAQYVDVKTSCGPFKFAYWVNTPSGKPTIDRTIPTILFLHTIFTPSIAWREQFAHPQFRRFNLIAVDSPGHGWTQGDVPETYSQEDAAAGIAAFMDALELPPVFLCPLSAGTIPAMELAIKHPEKILGMFLIAPMGTEETEHARAAREEICTAWKEAMADPGGKIDEEALEYAISGIFQLFLTGQVKPIAIATALVVRDLCTTRWSHSGLREFETCAFKYETTRHGHSTDALAKSLQSIPVVIVYGTSDVAYDCDYYAQFEKQLRDAGVQLEVHVLEDAPHCLNVSHQDDLAALVPEFVLRHCANPDTVPPAVDAPDGELPTVFDEAMNLKAFYENLEENGF